MQLCTDKGISSILMILWLLWLLQSTVDARTPKDCEIVNLRSINESISLTLEESLLMSIFSSEKRWDVSLLLSDSKATECSLLLKRDGGNRYVGVKCTDTEAAVYQEKMEFGGIWINIQLDVITCIGEKKQCRSKIGFTFDQEVPLSNFKTLWIETPLQPPLWLEWNRRTSADVTFGCESTVCVQNSTTLVAPVTIRRRSFFLKPGESFQGFTLLLQLIADESFLETEVDMQGVSLSEHKWLHVQLEKDNHFQKITVDDQELFRNEYQGQFRIQSIQLKGNGMLSWCDPRASADSPPDHTKSTVIGILVLTIFILSGVFIYFWNKSFRVTQVPNVPASLKQPAPAVTRQPLPVPRSQPASPVNEEYIYGSEVGENMYSTLSEHIYLAMNGRQSYVSMAEPSLYDEVETATGKESTADKEGMYINVH